MSLYTILEEAGFSISSRERIHGGDINQCWRVVSGNTNFFLKINSAEKYRGMFRLEAAALKALKENSSFAVPAVIKEGTAGTDQYLLLEYLAEIPATEASHYETGKMLALLHQHHFKSFGWEADNYIGSLIQVNTWCNDWSSFYTDCRIMPLVKNLFEAGLISSEIVRVAEKFCLRLPGIFPVEPASLLHGDLWSGNYMNTAKGPSVFDPAVYYGHREMDLGMTRLFGGFSESFYDGYQEIFPLEKKWEERIKYTQLYPLLVHAILFKGSYIERCCRILVQFK